MFLLSYSPFIFMLVFSISVLALLFMAILDQAYILEIDMSRFLGTYFEPVLFVLVFLITAISVILAIFYWFDIGSNVRLGDEEKRKWKKLYVKTSLFANAFYYDYKYGNHEPPFFLESFLRKSKNKMFGHVEIPKRND